MNRLQFELRRLYGPESAASPESDAPVANLVDGHGQVRALVMELTQPPSWEVLSQVWQAVQSELEFPPPAIAVSGVDGLQLWFSLAEPIPVSRANDFLTSLRSRFLPEIAARRVRLLPATDASAFRPDLHARLVPAEQQPGGNWSAFVAADLAPVFDDTPWLDIPPGEEGQANLLRGLASIKPALFEAATQRLAAALQPARSAREGAVNDSGGSTSAAAAFEPEIAPEIAPGFEEAKRFLVQVMNDPTVALALRIEAAKALLLHSDERSR